MYRTRSYGGKYRYILGSVGLDERVVEAGGAMLGHDPTSARRFSSGCAVVIYTKGFPVSAPPATHRTGNAAAHVAWCLHTP